MKFLIVSHVLHKSFNGQIWAYGPYVREMNLWGKYIDELIVVAPIITEKPNPIDLPYNSQNIKFVDVPKFNLIGVKNKLITLFSLPVVIWKIFWAMKSADHIHLRCPGNMGLLGAFVQILFPKKKKTAKYAGNWDPKMNKIKSYNLQRKLLSNTFLTRDMKVLVYGEWPNQSRNILPFFTASYKNEEIENSPTRRLEGRIKCLYCGFLLKEKRPLQTVKVVEQLHELGKDIELTLLGEGPEFNVIDKYIKEKNLQEFVFLKGNVNANQVKKHMQTSHFLTFYGHDSEGWPKAVAESMFWGCVPLVRSLSCTEYMLGYEERGKIVEDSVQSMVDAILYYLDQPVVYYKASDKAMEWSRNYTLEKFESEIKLLLEA